MLPDRSAVEEMKEEAEQVKMKRKKAVVPRFFLQITTKAADFCKKKKKLF